MTNLHLILSICIAISSTSAALEQPQVVNPSSPDPYPGFSQYYFKHGYGLEPAPEKKAKGGEDSLLASKALIAVADGVGGWAAQGIDPSIYSLNLIKNVQMYFNMLPKVYAEQPKNLLRMAAKTNPHEGSSTLVICTLWQDELRSVNFGDSGFAVLTPVLKTASNGSKTYIYDFKYISPPQQYQFNFPYQLGNVGKDESSLAKETSHKIRFGDIVIVYSDGISDNVFPGQLRQLLNFYLYKVKQKFGIQVPDVVRGFDGNEFAKQLKDLAFQKSTDKNYLSPFGLNGLDFGVLFKGGKSDDISVVAAIVDRKPIEKEAETENSETDSSVTVRPVTENSETVSLVTENSEDSEDSDSTETKKETEQTKETEESKEIKEEETLPTKEEVQKDEQEIESVGFPMDSGTEKQN